jgi:hypothetical protein
MYLADIDPFAVWERSFKNTVRSAKFIVDLSA